MNKTYEKTISKLRREIRKKYGNSKNPPAVLMGPKLWVGWVNQMKGDIRPVTVSPGDTLTVHAKFTLKKSKMKVFLDREAENFSYRFKRGKKGELASILNIGGMQDTFIAKHISWVTVIIPEKSPPPPPPTFGQRVRWWIDRQRFRVSNFIYPHND